MIPFLLRRTNLGLTTEILCRGVSYSLVLRAFVSQWYKGFAGEDVEAK